jgi:DNA-binding GntR family transcriptional regulator
MPNRVAAPLRQQVMELVTEAINDGTYRAGTRLVEHELCARYQVSRTVVREALRYLEAQGLVTIVPDRGPVVATLTTEEAAWLYEVRAALEGLAGRCFAVRATQPEKAALSAAVEQFEKSLPSMDFAELQVIKDQFYGALFEGAHNPVIASMLRTLHGRIQRLRSLSLSAPGRGKDTLSEIRAIMEAAISGNAALASELATKHVQMASTIALERLAATEETSNVDTDHAMF